jgi:hypothetical protein
MKTITFLLLLCASAYGTDITTTNVAGDITTVISERRSDDGKPELRAETLYRSKEKILQIFSHPNKEGKTAMTSRTYFAGGKLVMVESDEDGDGTFSHFAVFLPGRDDLEMFTREPDRSVKPASTKEIELVKKESDLAVESFLKMKPGMSDQDIGKSLQETRQKIRDLQKQEKDEKSPTEPLPH